ncbi:cytochrome P450 [Mucidula mucida]|nr:cytochrome P450 [Mucidula mucida]
MALTDSPATWAVLLGLVCLVIFKPSRRVIAPYPPGPKAYPLIGNLLDLPSSFQWLTFQKWAQTHGDIMYVHALGQNLVVINSAEVAEDLLAKRSRIYSDRPEITVMGMAGWHINMGLKHYGEEWRRDRRIMQQRLRREETSVLHPVHLNKCKALLHDLLTDQAHFEEHFKRFPASVMTYAVYGHNAEPQDELLELTYETIGLFSGALFPGTNLLNMCPPLRHIPPWIPLPILPELHKRCAYSRKLLRQIQNFPYSSVKKSMEAGTAVPCWTVDMIEKNSVEGAHHVPEDVVKAVGVTTFAAAMETVLSVLLSFTLAMIQFPHIQAKAQAEIDAVIGNDRLPTFEDRDSLVYVEALVREVLRWHGPFPLGVPHSSTEDDVYKGYFIPKGTTIIYNQWAMSRDERFYANPYEFSPERFITPEGTISEDRPPVFGFGRRVCVGRWAADASMWIAIVSILAVFRLGKPKTTWAMR